MDLHSRPTLSSYGKDEIATAVAKLVASDQASPVIGSPLLAASKAADSSGRPVLKITEDILGSRIPLAGNTYLPSPSIGQCVSVDRIIALSLSALLHQPNGTERSWVAEQINSTGNHDATKILTPAQADNIAGQAMRMATDVVLPILIQLGVYRQIKTGLENILHP